MTQFQFSHDDPAQELLTRLDANNRALASHLGEIVPPEVSYAPSAISTAAPPNVFAAASSIGSPPKVMELPPREYLNTTSILVDRFALNPGADYYKQALPGGAFAYQPPSMFGSGDYPVITASGVDVSVLRWCCWWLRHAAAWSPSRAFVLEVIEQSIDGAPHENLQTADGREHLGAYFSRIATWVTTPVPDAEPTDEEVAQLWPEGRGPG